MKELELIELNCPSVVNKVVNAVCYGMPAVVLVVE